MHVNIVIVDLLKSSASGGEQGIFPKCRFVILPKKPLRLRIFKGPREEAGVYFKHLLKL